MSGYVTAAVVVGGAIAASSYTSRKAGQKTREAAASAPKAPAPTPAAKPPTLAQAMSSTGSNRVPGAGGGRRGGTLGDQGPQGLAAPPKTTGVTLLGGTQ